MIMGVVLLAVMQNGLILLGVSSYWSQFFVGLVILIAVSAISLERRRQRAATRRIIAEAAA